jgi:hypothetical protein
MNRVLLKRGVLVAAMFLTCGRGLAEVISFNEPTLDRWMYEHNGDLGARPSAGVFAAVGSPSAPDRYAQFLLGFDTAAASVPTGLGASNYVITSVRLTLTTSTDNTFAYDPTYDPFTTYLETGVQGATPDADTGRPIELYGVGFRNGYTKLGGASDPSPQAFRENSPHGNQAAPNAYAFAYDANGNPVDIINNVEQGFDPSPWAIGQTTAVTAGNLVPIGTEFTFDLLLSDPDVLAYLQQALNDGILGLMISSLHPAAQQTGGTFPSFFTKENVLHDPPDDLVAARLELDVTTVPEPSAVLLLTAAGGLLFLRRRRGGEVAL